MCVCFTVLNFNRCVYSHTRGIASILIAFSFSVFLSLSPPHIEVLRMCVYVLCVDFLFYFLRLFGDSPLSSSLFSLSAHVSTNTYIFMYIHTQSNQHTSPVHPLRNHRRKTYITHTHAYELRNAEKALKKEKKERVNEQANKKKERFYFSPFEK